MREDEQKEAQEKYVQARVVDGKTQREAAAIAGYSPGTNPSQIERVGGPVHNLMVKALQDRGITEEKIADEYARGMEAARQGGAKDLDLNAHTQYLKQLGFLFGYAKNTPSVAVQINNGTGGSAADDAPPTRELVEQVKALVEALAVQVGRDRSSGVLSGDPGATDAQAHNGMGESSPASEAAGGGGQP